MKTRGRKRKAPESKIPVVQRRNETALRDDEEDILPKRKKKKPVVNDHPAVIDILKKQAIKFADKKVKQFMPAENATEGHPLTGKKIRQICTMTKLASKRGQAGCPLSRYNFEFFNI